MDHPDEMSPVEHFRILAEERPDDAGAILEHGAMAVQALLRIRDVLFEHGNEIHRHAMTYNLGPILTKPDSLGQVAADYGILVERYRRSIDAANDVLSIAMDVLGNACPTCGLPHPSGDEPDESDCGGE